jgi:hypothetical protein
MLLDYEKKALYFEVKKDYSEALRLYYKIRSADSLSDLSKRANNKIDILLQIVKNEAIIKLNGKWRLKELKSNDTNIVFTKLIQINNKEILYIEEVGGKEEVITNQSFYIEPYIKNEYYEFPTIKSGKNEVWVLSFRKIKNEERLIWERKVDKNGNIYMTIDDRGNIRDSIKRKKALEDEIHTYYVKVK